MPDRVLPRASGAHDAPHHRPTGDEPRDTSPSRDAALHDPARLHLLAETGLIAASAAARLPTLDRVARLAARAVRAPVAQVNLVTADAQVPAAAFVDPALPGPEGASLAAADADLGGAWRLPAGLDASYCQHAVRTGAPVVVEDAAADAHVRHSRATTGTGVRAYASVPLLAPAGEVIGTVCVVDFRPRTWEATDVAALEECAALAGEEVAARIGAAHALRETEDRLREALQAARAAVADRERLLADAQAARAAADLERRRLETLVEHLPVGVTLAEAPDGRLIASNGAVRRIWGLDTPAAQVADYSHHYIGYRPGTDRPYGSDEWPLARALTRAEVVTDEMIEIVRPDASRRLVSVSAAPVRDDDGRVLGGVVTSTDVTERERLLAAERDAYVQGERERARLYTILRQLPAGVALTDGPEHRFVFENAAYRATVGDRPLLGLTPRDAFPDLADQGFHEAVERVYASGEAEHMAEVPAVLRDPVDGGAGAAAREVVLDLHLIPVRDAQERTTGVLSVHIDVTARVRGDAQRRALLAELAAERASLRSMILQTPAPLALLVGREHRFELVNPAYRRISGGGRDVTGLTPQEAFPELAGSGFFELFDRVYETGEAWDGPETLVRYDRDGTGVQDTWFNLRFEPVRDADGRVTALLNFAVDVTEQVRARRETERFLAGSERARADAEAAQARSEAVLASIADAFYLLDHEWRFTYVNDAAEPLLQTTRDALLGRTLWEAFPSVVGSPFEGPYREAMATGRVTSAEAYFEPLGTWFDVRTYPWAGGLMVHFRDIGERKAAEAERERLLADAQAARGEAEAANRAKSEFLAVMSHELRTPLNAIGGYAELMEMGIRGPVTPQQREDLRRVQTSQRHLLGLINEVLNYAKLETGMVDYHTTAVSLREALAEAEALVAPQARAKGLRLNFAACDPDLAAHADAEKLRQVLVNLLSNAVKFTDPRGDQPGQIELSCAAEGAQVIVRVRDTGIGIPADKLAAIFDPFVQVRADLTRTAEGTGLGLAISRDLARGMGGNLEVESEVGAGSTFTLVLPLA
jgi:PAS domain S-box-containing protein